MLQAREHLMETIQAFLNEYDHIPLEEKYMALLLAEERFLKIKQAMEEEQNQPKVMQELLLKLMNDLQILKGIQPKQAEKPKAITSDLPTEEPDNSLNMGDEHLNTIPETEKSSVENLVPIPSELKDEILREKLLNINLLVDKIEALKLTLPIPFVLENPSSSPIPVGDSDFLIEEIDTFLVSEDSIHPGGGEIDVSQNIEDDDSFAFVIRTFLSYRTYHVDSPLLLSTGSEDTIFDPGIST
ncbi:hypothetical protein Tco_0757705 [Tanacetum coccineum]